MQAPGGARQLRGARGFQSGLAAESWAAFFLLLKGYRILGQRLRTPYGEVDILAQKGSDLVVVEVKSRVTLARSAESISSKQQKRLMEAGQHLFTRYGKNCAVIRCDAFLFGKGGWPRHIRNAFGE